MEWKELAEVEIAKPYMKELHKILSTERDTYEVYPQQFDIFNAFKLAKFNDVKVVIIGQDPYHGPNQAMGLSFSVNKGVKIPPSLRNIYKELEIDIDGFKIPTHGDLTSWAKQGVLLLNSTLTVRKGEANSHSDIGWSTFTNAMIKGLSDNTKGIVFLLWGAFAQQFESLIDTNKHHILKAAHPSPFSASRGFFGCGHFSKINEILESQNQTPINWQL